MKRFFAILMAFLLVISGLPVYSANAAAYDPVAKTEGEAKLDLRFWEDQQPDVGFYINAANRYILETVKAPQMGSTFGEWSVMDLLRGSYSGSDYLNYIPANYYEDYLDRIDKYVISKGGNLDNNKSTEWSRLTLTMSSLGKDIRAIGKTGQYLKTKEAMSDGNGGYKLTSSSGSQGLGVVEVKANQFILKEPAGVLFGYTNRSNKPATVYQILAPGTYTLLDDNTIIDEKEKQVTFSYEEKSGSTIYAMHTLTTIPSDSVVVLEKPYDFIEKLSTSYAFSYKQGINGPIWILIALHTGGYSLYSEDELKKRGIDVAIKDVTINKIKVKMKDLNTEGRMIDYILDKEITNNDGRVGGWALSGKNADPDITMMAVQGLAPYYLSEEAFKNAYKETIDPSTIDLTVTDTPTGKYYDVESKSFKEKYTEFKKAVERAVFVMAEDQKPNGGYSSWGTTNSESTVQVIVGLTALGIDPMSDKVYLPIIDQTVSFIKEGGIQDGVTTNNMIDALISFWAMGSGSSSEVSGFKHVTQGYDGGGGSGTSVNAMATDQAIYGLIAYDRFLKKEKRLYDMTDMINGEYKTMKGKKHTYTYMVEETTFKEDTFSPYEVLTMQEPPTKEGYKGVWTTKADGTGAVYKPGERLSTPDHPITLYAHYVIPYEITYELNDGQWIKENAEEYAPARSTLTLPTAAHIQKENHVFDGWFATEDFQGEAITTLSDTTQLEHTLFAKWVSFEALIAQAEAAINLIPTEAQLSLADETTVQKAREVFDSTPESLKEKVSNSNQLLRAEDLLNIFKAETKITALPEKINLTHISLMDDLTTFINQLPGTVQVEISNLDVYKEKLKQIQQLQQQATDLDFANSVRKLIEALPNKVALDDQQKIEDALLAYKRLTETQQQLIEFEYSKLVELEKQLTTLLNEQNISQFNSIVSSLPSVDKLTLEHKEKIVQLYDLFQALSEEQKQKINQKQVHQMVAALIELQIKALPATVTEDDRKSLDSIRFFYNEVDSTIQNLVSNYKVLNQKYNDLDNYPKVTKANTVITKINAIPSTVTVNSISVIQAARLAYDALTSDEKAFVTNYSKLTQAENSLAIIENSMKLEANQLVTAIRQLPTTITLAQKDTVLTLQSAYNALSSSAKAQVTNASTLTKAIQTINTLETQEAQVIKTLQTAISNLPDVTKITVNHKLIIEDVRQKYNSLTSTQKANINISKLVDAEAQLKKLTNEIEQKISETKDKLVIQAATTDTKNIATITPALLKTIDVPTIEIESNKGIKISLPKNVLTQYSTPVQVSTNISTTGFEPSIDIKIGTLTNAEQVATRLNKPFTVRIPASTFAKPIAAKNIAAFEPGVILGYSTEKGYYAVPHIYKDGEFIVTISEGHTLVHRSEQITFDDIQRSGFKNEIEYLASRFVIKGYEDGTFKPNKNITRGQFAVLISRALDLKPTKATTFRDAFYSPNRDDIQAVYESGIMQGYNSTKFGVNDPLTREQAAVAMARILEYKDYEAKRNLVHYKDKEKIKAENVKSIELLNTLDIMSGDANGYFKPKNHLTRAQLAKILQRTLKLVNVM